MTPKFDNLASLLMEDDDPLDLFDYEKYKRNKKDKAAANKRRAAYFGRAKRYERSPSEIEQQAWLDQEAEADYPEVDPSISPVEDYGAAISPPKKGSGSHPGDDYYYTKSFRNLTDPKSNRDIDKKRKAYNRKQAEKKLDEDWAEWQQKWKKQDEKDKVMKSSDHHHQGYLIKWHHLDLTEEDDIEEYEWIRADMAADWVKEKYDKQDIPWDEYEQYKQRRRAEIGNQYSGHEIGSRMDDSLPSRSERQTAPWWGDVI